jgi:hypothetical protein
VTALYHGGVHGLAVGDLLVPSPPHQTDGCPICVARAEGRVLRVGEYRAWLAQFGERARPVLEQLAGADDSEPMDPPSAREAIYLTTDLEYARWYAARSQGDLYEAVAIGEAVRSTEDHFPSWTAETARVVRVLERRVRLDRRDRRALLRRWKKADDRAARQRAGGTP